MKSSSLSQRDFNDNAVAAVKASGFLTATTVVSGFNSHVLDNLRYKLRHSRKSGSRHGLLKERVAFELTIEHISQEALQIITHSKELNTPLRPLQYAPRAWSEC
jgi:hypothetical protein